jgi:hypothetical protein
MLLAGYAVWAAVSLPDRMDTYLGALTSADRNELAGDVDLSVRTAQAALPFHITLGIVAIAVSLIAIPVALRYDRGRLALWWLGPVVAVGAVILMLGSDDVNVARVVTGQLISATAKETVDLLLPPGFLFVDYLSLATIAVAIAVACFSLVHRDSAWYLTRGRKTSTDPRWT